MGDKVRRFENAKLHLQDTVRLALSLRTDQYLESLEIISSELGDAEVIKIFEALWGNNRVQRIDLSGNEIGSLGTSAIAEALIQNPTIMEIILQDNAVTSDGAVALADALKMNKTLTRLDLTNSTQRTPSSLAIADALLPDSDLAQLRLVNRVDSKGAVALAQALRINRTLKFLSLHGNWIGDVGMLALTSALDYNSTIEEIDVRNVKYTASDVTDALQRSTRPGVMRYSPPSATASRKVKSAIKIACQSPEFSAFDVNWLLQHWLSRRHHHLCDGSYCAVGAARVGNLDAALWCLRRWPATAQEVLSEKGGWIDVNGRLLNAGSKNTEVVQAVVAVASLIRSTGELAAVNVHMCGDSYAGKTMLARALESGMQLYPLSRFFLHNLIPEIPIESGRTMGMVTMPVTCAGPTSERPTRLLIHDYSGLPEFRTNHSAHLAAPNSVYIVVVPLWDKRPYASGLFQLGEIVAMYESWLKYIYAVCPKVQQHGGRPCCAPKILTVLNFERQFRDVPASAAAYSMQDVFTALQRVQTDFNTTNPTDPAGSPRVRFVGPTAAPTPGTAAVSQATVIAMDANYPPDVYDRLAPVLRRAVADLSSTAALPTPPCLQAVLSELPKWPVFTPEGEMQILLKRVLKTKYGQQWSAIADPIVRGKVLSTVSKVVQDLLERRRDLVVFPMPDGHRVSLNSPNWLTSKVMGCLFSPRSALRLTRGFQAHTMEEGAERETVPFLFSVADINTAVARAASDAVQQDPLLISRALRHVGACVAVQRNADGTLCAIAADTDTAVGATTDLLHWFPAYCGTQMTERDGSILPGANHVIARLFALRDIQNGIFPPGYFPSLFMSVVSLFNRSEMVQLFNNGMMVISSTDSTQIVLRVADHGLGFHVTIATTGTSPGCTLAFDTLQRVKQLISGSESSSGWRGHVLVDEYGLHPGLPAAAGIAVHILERRLRVESERESCVGFYFGVERTTAGCLIPAVLKSVVSKLVLLDESMGKLTGLLKQFKDELASSLAQIRDDLSRMSFSDAAGLVHLSERLQVTLHHAESFPVQTTEDLQGLCADLVDVFRVAEAEMNDQEDVLETASMDDDYSLGASTHMHDGFSSRAATETLHAVSVALELPLQALQAALFQSTQLSVEQLLCVKAEVLAELSALVAEMLGACERLASNAQDSLEHAPESDGVPAPLSRQLSSDKLPSALSEFCQLQDEDGAPGSCNLPLLVTVSQPPSTGLSGLFKRHGQSIFLVHFLCPVCCCKAPSGPRGRGYELSLPKAWLPKLTLLVGTSLRTIRQLAEAATAAIVDAAGDVPVVLTDAISEQRESLQGSLPSEDSARILGLTQELTATRCALGLAPSLPAVVDANTAESSEVDVPAQHTVGLTVNEAATGLESHRHRSASEQQGVASAPEGGEYMRELLRLLGEVPSNPRYTGLRCASCPLQHSQKQSQQLQKQDEVVEEVQWVCGGCEERYGKDGDSCLAETADVVPPRHE